MLRPLRIEGYAIVSEDGTLANAVGIMPDSLKFEADQQLFARGLGVGRRAWRLRCLRLGGDGRAGVEAFSAAAAL